MKSRGLPRPVEAALAAAGLGVTWPALAAIGVAVRLSSAGPALFKQIRVGQGGTPFTLYKFRTMRPSAPAVGAAQRARVRAPASMASGQQYGPGVTAKGDPRITRVGRILRKTKLDELPELWNVLRGDLSLVGPRPEVPEYVDLQDPLWREVLEERPGLTHPVTLKLRNEEELLAAAPGPAAEYYRSTLLPYKLRGCVRYRNNRTWHSDVRVLVETLRAIVDPRRNPPPSAEEVLG